MAPQPWLTCWTLRCLAAFAAGNLQCLPRGNRGPVLVFACLSDMSRSLDPDIIANLRSEDPTAVYQDISAVLTQSPGSIPLEIELLGNSHPLEPGIHLLQDGNAVAIPKLRLVQAFFVARRIIADHLARGLSPPGAATVQSTAVALLMDPEHLTAANIRKRAIVCSLTAGNSPPEPILRQEKHFVDSLLTSRLHRHTKSPTLWSHRRWLMNCFNRCHMPIDIRLDLTSAIMVAAERHPRNYYAWHHARWLLCNSTTSPGGDLLTAVASDVKQWCFKHHNDVSGWSYLGFLLVHSDKGEAERSDSSAIFEDTLGLARSFRWTNESVWAFLRTVAASPSITKDAFELFLSVNSCLLSTCSAEDDTTAANVLREARQWASQHRKDA